VPSDVDEAHEAGLELVESELVKPPRVARAPVHLERRHVQTVTLRQNGTYAPGNSALIIGEVVGIHIDEELVVDGRVDITRARPIARLGYAEYAVVDSVFRMVPPWIA